MADTLNEYFFSLVKTKGFNYQGGRMSIDCLNIIDSCLIYQYSFLSCLLNFTSKLIVLFFLSGERVIRHRSEMMASEILVNPQLQTLTAALKNFFSIDMPYKYLVFAGPYMEGSGAWVLQDDIFSVSKVVSVLNDPKLKVKSKKFCVQCHQEGEWKQVNLLKVAGFKDHGFTVTPTETQTNHHGIIQFAAYISNFVKPMTITDLMKSTDLVGSLKFTSPTMYIFPGCEGDSALFAMREFNLLINGGFRRKSCFWDFARHLERIDAMLITHLGIDNVFGMSSLLQRKSEGKVSTDIGYVYMNASEKPASPNGLKLASLKINVAEEGTGIVEACKKIGLAPHPCTRANSSSPLAPVNLYHKVGHGTLDMYVLNPVADSKELKEFLQQWQKNGADFGISQGMPLPNLVSICALLVWKPANPSEKIIRILFPGNAPQHKIAEGLEKVKHLDFLKFPSCSAKDLSSKGAGKKPPAAATRPSSGKPAVGRLSLEAGKAAAKPPNDTKAASSKSLNGQSKARPSTDHKAPPKSVSDTKVSSKAEATKPEKKDVQRSKSDLNKTVDKHKAKPIESPKHTAPKAKVEPKKTSKPPEEKSSNKGTPSKSTPKKDIKPVAESTPKKASPEKETRKSPVKNKAATPTKPKTPTSEASAKPPVTAEPDKKDIKVPSEPEVAATGNLLDFDPFSNVSQGLPTDSGVPAQQQNLMDDPFSMKNNTVPDEQDLIQPSAPVAFSQQEPDVIPEAFPNDMAKSFSQPEQDLMGEPDVVPPGQVDKFSDNLMDDEGTSVDAISADRALQSPVEPAAATMDALDKEDAELEDGEDSADELDSQGDSAEVTADPESQGSQDDAKPIDREEDVSPFAFENKGFTDLSQNQDEGVDEMSEQTNTSEEKSEAEDKGESEKDDESHGGGPQEVPAEDKPFTEPVIFDDGFHENENSIQREINYQANGAPLDSIREEDDAGHGRMTDSMGMGLNPFNGLDQAQINQPSSEQKPFASDDPFHGQLSMGYQPAKDPVSMRQIPCQEGYEFDPYGEGETKSDSGEEDIGEFDADKDWGRPMGLPSPPPPEEKAEAEVKKTEKVANGKHPKPASSSKEPAKSSNTTNKTATSRAATSKSLTEKKGGLNTTRTEKLNTSRTETSSSTTSKPRPASATVGEPKTKPASKRPATATGSTRASPSATKMPSMPALHAYYMDLAYIPNHGNPATCDVEFFKRVRAKHYVYSSMNPNTQTLNALLDAKASWQEPDLQVTLIPTYDTDVLRQWMVEKQERLTELKVEVAPSASRCTVQLQEHETCCLAYRLELCS